MIATQEIRQPQKPAKIRYLSIDIFRGVAIAGMIFANTIAAYKNVPAWSKHATDFGLTYIDLIAPFFIFAITLTFKMSFDSYLRKDGLLKTYLRFLRRFGAFIGFGVLGSQYILTINGISFSWDVL